MPRQKEIWDIHEPGCSTALRAALLRRFWASAIIEVERWKRKLFRKRAIYMVFVIALLTGRCTYSLGDGGYDLSRFRENAELSSVPDELRGIVQTNGEAARAISAQNDGGDLRLVIIGDTISDNNRHYPP